MKAGGGGDHVALLLFRVEQQRGGILRPFESPGTSGVKACGARLLASLTHVVIRSREWSEWLNVQFALPRRYRLHVGRRAAVGVAL